MSRLGFCCLCQMSSTKSWNFSGLLPEGCWTVGIPGQKGEQVFSLFSLSKWKSRGMHGTSSTPNEIEPLFTKPNLTQMCLQKRVRDSRHRMRLSEFRPTRDMYRHLLDKGSTTLTGKSNVQKVKMSFLSVDPLEMRKDNHILKNNKNKIKTNQTEQTKQTENVRQNVNLWKIMVFLANFFRWL